MTMATILLVDDEAPFVETMIKRLKKETLRYGLRMTAKKLYVNWKTGRTSRSSFWTLKCPAWMESKH